MFQFSIIPINLLLILSYAKYYHSANFTCSVFDTLLIVEESSLKVYRTPSQHSKHHIDPWSSAISISNATSSTVQSALDNSSTTKKSVFVAGLSIDSKNSDNNGKNYNGGSEGTIPDSMPPCRTHRSMKGQRDWYRIRSCTCQSWRLCSYQDREPRIGGEHGRGVKERSSTGTMSGIVLTR